MADSNAWREANKKKAREAQNRYNAEHRSQVRENKQRWYQTQKKKRRLYANEYYAENAKKAKARVRAYRKAHPERSRAAHQVEAAVKTGKLVRPVVCSACGHRGKTDAHHADYAKPYDVEWLCRKCHRSRHKSVG